MKGLSCPICSGKYTIREVYQEWSSGLDNQLCERHKKLLDIMADIATLLDSLSNNEAI